MTQQTSAPTDSAFDNPPLPSFFGERDDDPEARLFDRPERTEDKVPRDRRDKPRILPLGKTMPDTEAGRDRVLRSYARPSEYAKVLENRYNLERWTRRQMVSGMLSSRLLRLQWAALGDIEADHATKEAADAILKEAKREAGGDTKANEGTGLHALTERHDMGLSITYLPEEFEEDLAEWVRLTQHFEILAVEVFVVCDAYKAAGTFDRLVRYHEPCPTCGRTVRVLDLKSGHSDKVKYGGMSMASQLAIYANSANYDPATGLRTPLGVGEDEVCPCRGIIIDLPAGTGRGTRRWLNISKGWNDVVRLATEVKEIQKAENWWLPMEETVADFTPLIRAANSTDEINALWRQYRAFWRDRHTAIANAVIEQKGLA